jgi:hypothetical protein
MVTPTPTFELHTFLRILAIWVFIATCWLDSSALNVCLILVLTHKNEPVGINLNYSEVYLGSYPSISFAHIENMHRINYFAAALNHFSVNTDLFTAIVNQIWIEIDNSSALLMKHLR